MYMHRTCTWACEALGEPLRAPRPSGSDLLLRLAFSRPVTI